MMEMLFVVNKHSIPFSAGKRDCPGQTLAVKEVYAFFANILLKYKILAPGNDPNTINITRSFGEITLTVEPQIGVVVKYRQ